ncbi:MAG: YihY/virulence factor BrkB family protein [Chloroflexi bacterium]|nr:MAG: YihY/virulence factor BrkB family protein [Chloroflexota bacterium]
MNNGRVVVSVWSARRLPDRGPRPPGGKQAPSSRLWGPRGRISPNSCTYDSGQCYTVAMRRITGFVICFVRALAEDELSTRAAALAYYAVFSLFPLMLLLTSAVGFFLADAQRRQPVVDTMQEFTSLIPGWAEFAQSTLEGMVRARGGVGVLGVAGVLWSASGFFRGLEVAVNVIFHTQQRRSIWRSRAMGMLMAVFTLPLVFLATLLILIGSTVAHVPFLPPVLGQFIQRATNPLATLAVVILAFLLLYEFIPRRRPPLRSVLVGAVVAGCGWAGLTLAFNRFLASGLVDYNVIYGSIGAVIALILWLYLTSLIILVGAEVAAHLAGVRECAPEPLPGLADRVLGRAAGE